MDLSRVEAHVRNLLECVNDWTLAVQNKQGVTIAYIDFARAFDTVSHKKNLLLDYFPMVSEELCCSGLKSSLKTAHTKLELGSVYQVLRIY